MKFRADFPLYCPHSALRICCWETKAHLEQNFRLHAQKFDSLICDLRQPMLSTVTLEALGPEILLHKCCKTFPQHVASSGTRRKKKNTVGHSLKLPRLLNTHIQFFSFARIQHNHRHILADSHCLCLKVSSIKTDYLWAHKTIPIYNDFIGSNLLKEIL